MLPVFPPEMLETADLAKDAVEGKAENAAPAKFAAASPGNKHKYSTCIP